MSSFNLVREPWIPVERLDGSTIDLSTVDALARSHELRGLADSSPLVVAALTRHLLAILHRSYSGPRTMKEWVAIASSGAFDSVRIERYLGSVEDRMDLFHQTHPFGQTPGLNKRFADYASPIDELEVLRSRWGGARELFRHRASGPRSMTPARAARALLAHHAFATGGLVKKPGEPTAATAAPLCRSGVVILRGPTFFLTLIANLVKYDPANNEPVPGGGSTDSCAWELPPPPRVLDARDEPKRAPTGYLDMLTWQSRRIELVVSSGLIVGFVNAVGQGVAEGGPRDPMVAYFRHDKLGLLPIGIDTDRAFWRDAGALFEAARRPDAPFERPRAIDLLSSIEALDILGREATFDVELLGLSAEKSRVDAVRVERVQSRARHFGDPDARDAVNDCLSLARLTVDALRAATFTYARIALAPTRDPDAKAARALADSFGLMPAVWSALGTAFDDLLRQLDSDPAAAVQSFRLQARRLAIAGFRSACARSDDTGRWLKARARAERELSQRLNQLFPVLDEVSA